MNEAFIYSALLVLLYTQSALQSYEGVAPQPPPWAHQLGWCDGSHSTTAPVHSPHTSYRWRREREMEPIQWMGIIRRPWLDKGQWREFGQTPVLYPYTFTMSVMGFLMTTESQDLGLTSHPKRRCFLQYSVPGHYTGALGPTQTTGWDPLLASLTPLPTAT